MTGVPRIFNHPLLSLLQQMYYTAGTVLSVLHVLTNFILIINELGASVPILQMWKLGHKEVKEPAYRTSKWQS